MSSELKSATARANGAKSRGPKTAAGLEKSSQNALKHGLTSRNTIVLACEDANEFKEMLDEYAETYQPANPAEEVLVREMVAARWRIHRMWMIETSLLDDEIARQPPSADPGIHLASAFRALSDNSRALSLSSRYESRYHRIYHRAYATLRELKSQNEPKPQPQPRPEPAPPGPTALYLKQKSLSLAEIATMPLYEYKCGTCGEVFEVIQKFSDTPLTVHEKCGGVLERLVSPSALQFKGSGWYVNDYGKGHSKELKPNGAKKDEKSNGGAAPAESKSDSGKSAKTESSPSTTATPAPSKSESKESK